MVKGQKIKVIVGYEDGSTSIPEYFEINFNFKENIWNDLINSKNCDISHYQNIIEIKPKNLSNDWSIEIKGLGDRIPRFHILPEVLNA
tara:strand:- start:1039 stop:1302 length:264 start_codon:yes stop_codon:yes gene_type:complete